MVNVADFVPNVTTVSTDAGIYLVKERNKTNNVKDTYALYDLKLVLYNGENTKDDQTSFRIIVDERGKVAMDIPALNIFTIQGYDMGWKMVDMDKLQDGQQIIQKNRKTLIVSKVQSFRTNEYVVVFEDPTEQMRMYNQFGECISESGNAPPLKILGQRPAKYAMDINSVQEYPDTYLCKPVDTEN
ncbi:hypothetical protein SHAb15599_00044 [Acinetobacter phage SH-Ab 15599]|nr:hypothetical protein SHAb15599_00044 [Acinetobacter phage SH-Ab 15599]